LPDSDFGATFELLNNDPGSYLKLDPGAFASAIERSFHEQILPGGSSRFQMMSPPCAGRTWA